MRKWFYKTMGRITGRNLAQTPPDVVVEQLNEPRPLPLGREEFEEWSSRIIAGALIPGATVASQKFVLANQILACKPTESHVPDAYFIHTLRKFAANQVADVIRTEIRTAEKARLETEESQKSEKQPEATVHNIGATKTT